MIDGEGGGANWQNLSTVPSKANQVLNIEAGKHRSHQVRSIALELLRQEQSRRVTDRLRASQVFRQTCWDTGSHISRSPA
jgi:hypothetical protein